MAPVHRRRHRASPRIAGPCLGRSSGESRRVPLVLSRADRHGLLGEGRHACNLRRASIEVPAFGGKRSQVVRSGGQRAVPFGDARCLRRSRRTCRRGQKSAGRRRVGATGQAIGPQDIFPLRRRCRPHPHVPQLREGWTKNLGLLFSRSQWLAAWRTLEFLLLMTCLIMGIMAMTARDYLQVAFYSALPVVTFLRIRRAHFSWQANILALFGLPLFSYLLLRSWLSHRGGTVGWKGRTYDARENSKVEPVRATIGRAS